MTFSPVGSVGSVFVPVEGAPAGFTCPAGVDGSASMIVTWPSGWSAATAELVWSPALAGAGNVRLTFGLQMRQYAATGAGGGSGVMVVPAPGDADQVHATPFAFVPDAGTGALIYNRVNYPRGFNLDNGVLVVAVGREGTDPSDTFANTITILGVRFHRAVPPAL